MRTPIHLSLTLLFLFLLNGCSTLSKSECQKGEWAKIGAKDASRGLRANTQLGQHKSACNQHKISPNNKQYYSGYARGLRTFCTRKSGFKHGANASEYLGVCPVALKREFLIGYLSGLDLAIDDVQVSIDNLRHERRRKNRKLDALEYKKGNKKKHRERVEKLNKHIDSLRSQIYAKRSQRNKLQAWHNVWSQ